MRSAREGLRSGPFDRPLNQWTTWLELSVHAAEVGDLRRSSAHGSVTSFDLKRPKVGNGTTEEPALAIAGSPCNNTYAVVSSACDLAVHLGACSQVRRE